MPTLSILPRRMTPEGKVKSDVRKEAHKLGFWVLHIKVLEMVGFPDLMVIGHGMVGFIEIKKPGKRPRTLQTKRIKQLRSYGIHADWTDNVVDARKFLNGLFKSS